MLYLNRVALQPCETSVQFQKVTAPDIVGSKSGLRILLVALLKQSREGVMQPWRSKEQLGTVFANVVRAKFLEAAVHDDSERKKT